MIAFEEIPKFWSGKDCGPTHNHNSQGPQDPTKLVCKKIGPNSPLQTPYFKSMGDFSSQNQSLNDTFRK